MNLCVPGVVEEQVGPLQVSLTPQSTSSTFYTDVMEDGPACGVRACGEQTSRKKEVSLAPSALDIHVAWS